MKKPVHVFLTALLLLTTFPIFAGDKKDVRKNDQRDVVYVGGQVMRPGEIPYRDNTTIFSMILAAGGPTQFGTLKRVKVSRGGKDFQMDLTNVKLKDHEFVQPDDCIEVPRMNLLGR